MKIDYIKKGLAACAMVVIASVSSAATYYFNAALITTTTVDPTDLSYWFVDAACTQAATNLPSFTDGNDELKFVNSCKIEGNPKILFNGDVNVKSITNNAGGASNMRMSPVIAATEGATIKTQFMNVQGYDCVVGGSNSNKIVSGSLSITGSAIGTADSRMGSVKSINVSGDVNIYSAGTNFAKFYTVGDGTTSEENPDVFIGGVVFGGTPRAGFDTQTFQFGSNNEQKIDANSYMWANGFTGSAGLAIRSTTTSTGSLTVVMTNGNAGSTSTGSLGVVYGYDTTLAGAKLSLVMKSSTYDNDLKLLSYADFSQSFQGDTMIFKGGVKMVSGSLFLNYKASVGADINHGTLSFVKAAGANVASFGNSNISVGGTFVFNDIVVGEGGGEIRVRMDKDDLNNLVYDALSLVNGITGVGNIEITLTDAAGGDPDGFYSDLIRTSAQDGLKVISWSNIAANTVTFSTKSGNEVVNIEGVDYAFSTFNGADGLYVAYVAVPEPATLAVLFGALVLGLAAWRRRK